ncbi:hypothetical protein GJ496_003281 [Pomphorhynchus laevis]|nr:hypothetical protein GJ496_003281 [Pomphorhynchus laevis]
MRYLHLIPEIISRASCKTLKNHCNSIVNTFQIRPHWQSRRMPQNIQWGYNEANGPDKWSKFYPEISLNTCQSPIDISTPIKDDCCGNLKLHYKQDCCQTITNNGHSLQISGIPQDSYISGGPLGDSMYRFAQFHIHWGEDDSCGSEHTINGKSYAGEIHIVNWNSTKFMDISSAQADMKFSGLCVLGILLEVDEKCASRKFDELVSNSERVMFPNSKALLRNSINIKHLLPEKTNEYFYYKGSLTTPPCTECVKWIVFAHPLKVSSTALASLRKLQSGDGSGALLHNVRPVQCRNNREVCRHVDTSKTNSSSSSSSDDSSE